MKSLLIIFLLLAVNNVFAQSFTTIEGTLFEKGTKKALGETNLYLLPHKIKTTTDNKGNFKFTDVPVGECQLIVNLSGYKKLELTPNCQSAQAPLKLFLEKIFYNTFETVIKDKFKKRDDQAHSLTQEEFLKMAGTFGGDPIRAAQNLPGVAQNGASAEIIVQGAAPEDTMYTVNGHQVPLVFHFGGLSSVIIPQAVDRVDLLPSGYGPEYSKAMGGVIGLTTKAPKANRIHGMAFVDLLNAGGLIEGPIDSKSSFLVSARYSYIGPVLKQVAKDNDRIALTAAPSFMDTTAIYQRELNEKNIFKTTFIFSRDELELLAKRPLGNDPKLRGNFYQRTQFFRAIPQLITQFNAKTKLDSSVALGKDQILIDISGRYLNIDSTKATVRSELSHEWSPLATSYFGMDHQFTWYDVGVNLPNSYGGGNVSNPFSVGEQRKFRSKGFGQDLGFYVRQTLKPSEGSKWTFLPNLRYDHLGLTQQGFIQPRFQTRYQLSPSLLLRASYGVYYQPPQPQEADKLYGNGQIKAPHATHYTLGFTKDFREGQNNGLEFTNNYFYKNLSDLVTPNVQQNYSNGSTGKIVGGEVQAKFRWNEFTSQIVYTYLHSQRTIPGFGTFPAEFDQTHNLNLIGTYQKERWTFSGRFRVVSGNPYTPVTSSIYDADNDVYIPVRGAYFSQRTKTFSQFDIRVDRKYIYDTWILSVYMDIQNALGTKNVQAIRYSYDYSQTDSIQGLPFLPTFGVKGEF